MNTNIKEFDFIINNMTSVWVWNDAKDDKWELNTFKWLEKNKGANIFWDIGAWVGPFTLYGSKIFNKVVAFEPDYVAFNALQDHIKDNQLKNVTIIKRGLYNEETDVNFGFYRGKFGDSLSSINSEYITNKYGKTYVASSNFNDPLHMEYKIKTITIEKSIELYGRPNILKIDIEGGEEYLIDDLIKFKFDAICIAIHNGYMKDNSIFLEKINKLFLPLYDCYSDEGKKIVIINGDEQCYFELKK